MLENSLQKSMQKLDATSKRLSMAELTQTAVNVIITDEDVVQLQQRLKQAEEKFEEKAMNMRPNQEWYDRRYTI